MNLEIDRSLFSGALAVMAAVADRKNTMPILSHVLLRVDKGRLTLAATDFATTVTRELECTSDGPGLVAINAQRLHDVIGSLSVDEVKISQTEAGHVEITAGRSKVQLTALRGEDYPKLPAQPSGFKALDRTLFLGLLERVVYAVCSDETRAGLSGVHYECDGKRVIAMASDGHRLALAETDAGALPKVKAALIPKSSVLALKRALEDVDAPEIVFTADHLMVRGPGMSFAAKLLGADFPRSAYDIVTKARPCSVTVSVAALEDAIARANTIAGAEKSPHLDLSWGDGRLRLATESDSGSFEDEIDAQSDGAGATAVRPKYLAEAISRVTDAEATISISERLDAIKVRGTDPVYTALVMPLGDRQ